MTQIKLPASTKKWGNIELDVQYLNHIEVM